MMRDMIAINDFLLFDSGLLMTARTVHVYGSYFKANDQPIMRIHGTCFQAVIYSQQNTMLSLNLPPKSHAYFKFDANNFDVFPLLAAFLSSYPGYFQEPHWQSLESICASSVVTTWFQWTAEASPIAIQQNSGC